MLSWCADCDRCKGRDVSCDCGRTVCTADLGLAVLSVGAAGFRLNVFPDGVSMCGLGVCCCLRYSRMDSVWMGVREDTDEFTE